MRTGIFQNPFSSCAAALAQEILSLLQQRQIPVEVFVEWPGDISHLTDAWIVGGDGTLNYFANKYPGCKIPLGIFPGGTGNDFHWMLYGSMSTAEQAALMLGRPPQAVDAGLCNDKLFINTMGIGFDAAITRQLKGKQKRMGKASYMLQVLQQVFFYNGFNWQNPGDGGWQHAFMINLSNGRRIGGGFLIAPTADPCDGLLDLNIIQQLTTWQRLRYLPVLEKGKHQQRSLSFLKHTKLAQLYVRTGAATDAHVDGEHFEAREFRIRCLPGHFLFRY